MHNEVLYILLKPILLLYFQHQYILPSSCITMEKKPYVTTMYNFFSVENPKEKRFI